MIKMTKERDVTTQCAILEGVEIVYVEVNQLTGTYPISNQHQQDGVIASTLHGRAVGGLEEAQSIFPSWPTGQLFMFEGRDPFDRESQVSFKIPALPGKS